MSLDMFPDPAIKLILDSEAERERREARELQIQGDPEGVLRRALQESCCGHCSEGCPCD